MVGALYVGFLRLLCTGEILTLKAGQIKLSVDSGVTLLALPVSKSAKLKNVGVSIVVSDPTARALLAFLCRGCSPQDWVFRLSFEGLASALVTAAAALGHQSSDLLPYSLRRGGATFFHFARYGSVDLTTHYVRWALATTARKYISSQAACDAGAI